MQIIKHGHLAPRYFVCDYCCCEFVADISEYEPTESGDHFFVCCPDCGRQFCDNAPVYEEA